MNNSRLVLVFLGATAVLLPACGGGGLASGGSSHSSMDLVQVSNGFGQLLPHTVFRLDANGNPTTIAIPIRTNDDLINNVTALNPVLPVIQYPISAILPSGLPGNHFMYATFDHDVDITSILDSSVSAQTGGGLTGTMTLVALDATSGQSAAIPVRVFVNGFTFAGTPTADDPDHLPLQHWVDLNATTGLPELLDVDGAFPGTGFPGTPGYEFSGSGTRSSPRTVLVIPEH